MEDSGSSDLGSNPGGTTTASQAALLFLTNTVFLGGLNFMWWGLFGWPKSEMNTMIKKWKKNNKIACSTMVLVMLMAGLSGCIGSDDSEETLRIAFSVKDDYASFDENPQKLADYLSDATGLNIELYPITSDSLALEALRFGSADMAFLDGGAAWMGWQSYGLEAMAADMKSDGRTYYSAHAWVLNDSAAGQAALDDDDATDPFAEPCWRGILPHRLAQICGYADPNGLLHRSGLRRCCGRRGRH